MSRNDPAGRPIGNMDTTHRDPNPGATRPGEPELELYTIPSYSSWFTWDDIHETERSALNEFFDGSSITRTPKIYKEYRDFIINKYREDPSRRLTLTEIRKSLVGDVSLLHKVFRFLDKWGLINFGATSSSRDDWEVEGDTGNVRVEEGAPTGVRVVATPNSLKPMTLPRVVAETGEAGEIGVRLPPLASYSDVFGELGKRKSFVCCSCGKNCDSSRFEYAKGNYAICLNCYKDGNYGENKTKDDFKLNDSIDNSANGAIWTESETLLLLESTLRHGDDWDLVAQNFPTKTKLDCISKLIELPFGDLLLGSVVGRGNSNGLRGSMNGLKQASLSSAENHTMKSEDQMHEQTNVHQQNGDAVTESPPLKRQRMTSLLNTGGSLMKQVAVISSMADQDVTVAAAKAAVAALCEESSFPKEIFDEEDFMTNGLCLPSIHSNPERFDQCEDSEMEEKPTQPEPVETSQMQNEIPMTLRLRAAVATALGVAAAHAKLLADQEAGEIENLAATILETQLKVLDYKLKNFDDLEMLMEKEYTELEELKESLIDERIGVLQRAINSGLPKWRDYAAVKSYSGDIL